MESGETIISSHRDLYVQSYNLCRALFLTIVLTLLSIRGYGQEECDVTLIAHSDTLVLGKNEYCIDISVHNFRDILGITLPLQYDTTQLEFVGASSDYFKDIGESNTDRGTLKLSMELPWGESLTLNNGDKVLTLCFQLISSITKDLKIDLQDRFDNVEASIFDKNVSLLRECYVDAYLYSPCAVHPIEFSRPIVDYKACAGWTGEVFFDLGVFSESQFPVSIILYEDLIPIFIDTFYDISAIQVFKFLYDEHDYSFTFINQYGCVSKEEIDVQYVEAGHEILIYDEKIYNACDQQKNGSIEFLLSPKGSIGEVHLEWNTGKTEQYSVGQDHNILLDSLAAGLYSVTITSDQCQITKNFDVLERPSYTVESTISDPSCGHSNGYISLDIHPPADYTYQWGHTTSTDANVGHLPEGRYNVTITDAAQCQHIEEITLLEEKIQFQILDTSSASCYNMDGTLYFEAYDNSGDSLLLYWSDGLSSKGLEEIYRSGLKGGDHWVAISNGGCTDTMSYSIPTSSGQYLDHDLFYAFPDSICDNDTIHLTPADFIFTTGSNMMMTIDGENVDPNVPVSFWGGTYHIELSDDDHCHEDTMITIYEYLSELMLPSSLEVRTGDTISLSTYFDEGDHISLISDNDIRCTDADCHDFIYLGEEDIMLEMIYTDINGCEYNHILHLRHIKASIPRATAPKHIIKI